MGREGSMVDMLTSHLCEPGLIPVTAVSCGLSLLLVLTLLWGFFSRFSGFLSSTEKPTLLLKFQFDLRVKQVKVKSAPNHNWASQKAH